MNEIKKQMGFALIEVLMAALVLTVGAVGYLKLQSIGLNGSRSSFSKSQAVEVSKTMVEFMRANARFRDSSIERESLSDVFGDKAKGASGEPLFVVISPKTHDPDSGSLIPSAYNQNTAPCEHDADKLACVKQLFIIQKFRIEQAMARNFAPGRAMICAMVNNDALDPDNDNSQLLRRKVRVDFIWRDNTNSSGAAREDLTAENCPESFRGMVKDNEVRSDVRNYVTIYSEI